jgi:hypothetical protein
MKRVAKQEPIVRVVEVADPVQVRLALRVVPPDVARLTIAVEGYVQYATRTTTPRSLRDLKVESYSA